MNTEGITITFVIPSSCESKDETSSEMQQAYEACRQNDINITWEHEKCCLDLQLKKTDFVVFQAFSGSAFDRLKESKKARIVGPWCLLTCLTEGKQIPNYPWPIFSVAMSGCTITCSSLPRPQKNIIHARIEYMAGLVSSSLTATCNYLVTDSVKSEKYIRAVESGMKIMLPAWVNEVWEVSAKGNIHCDDELFSRHRCPALHKLLVCCTGLSLVQRNELKKMVTENGGEYKEQLYLSKTDIVICEGSTASEKYKAAKKHKIKCVSLQWVTDSVANGYAMPHDNYVVGVGTSTPTKDGENFPPNFSMISNITNISLLPNASQFPNSIDGTELGTLAGITPIKSSSGVKRKSDSSEHNDLVDRIALKQVKMAGPFLDGCGVYTVGFGTEQREKLCKILNFSGATRYDDISERVTHVIVGDPACHELRLLNSKGLLGNCPLVAIQWLIDSITKQSPADEDKYIIRAIDKITDASSPLSKKSLQMLRTKSATPVIEKPKEAPVIMQDIAETDIVQQYLRPNNSSQDTLAKLLEAGEFESHQETSTGKANIEKTKEPSFAKPSKRRDSSLSSAVDDDTTEQTEPIFEGLKFAISAFTPDQQHQIKLAIELMSGKVVPTTYKGVPDYAVVPVFSSEARLVATNIVNDLWISECWQEGEIRPVEYFHQPISVKEDVKPLGNCVVTITTYTNYERNFLKTLIGQLGGICQELFSRTNSAKTGLLACTHLVSPEADGKKYNAAIKWGLPVLNKEWLLECARTSRYAPEKPYLVGAAECSRRGEEASRSTTSVGSSKSTLRLDDIIDLEAAENVPPQLQANTSFSTPPVYKKLNSSSSESTPANKAPKSANTSGVSSQVTPVQKIMLEARRQNLIGTPEGKRSFLLSWDHVDTPETPLGAFINPNPSPNLRKDMVRFLNTLPDWKPPPPRRQSTPLSELKRQLWDKICPPKDGQTNSNQTEEQKKPAQPLFDSEEDEVFLNVADGSASGVPSTSAKDAKNISEEVVNKQLLQLQDMLASTKANQSNSANRRQSTVPVVAAEVKDSQPNTVAWEDYVDCDDVQKPQKVIPVFMFSGIEPEERESLAAQLADLGGIVTNLANFDPSSTHLICPKPSRNEKILASMAAGKWILHPSYVQECVAQGKLVDEEPFEFGNPKSVDNKHMRPEKENDAQLAAMHYWRKEIARRGYGAFHDMRAIIAAKKRDPLVRVVQAGGGLVVEASPPFTEPVHATHCLLDGKSTDTADYIPIAKQGIYCLPALYIYDFLLRTAGDVQDSVISKLASYYK